MGKWARKRRTGSNPVFGSMPAPVAGDFTAPVGAAPNTTVNRIVAAPSPATGYYTRSVAVVSGANINNAYQTAAAGTVSTPTAGVQYRIYAAWGNATDRLSEFFLVNTVTP